MNGKESKELMDRVSKFWDALPRDLHIIGAGPSEDIDGPYIFIRVKKGTVIPNKVANIKSFNGVRILFEEANIPKAYSEV